MDNRERDRVSQRNTPTEAGETNRQTEEEKGRRNSGTGTEFGQSIGRPENLSEGGDMRNKQEDTMKNNFDNEPSRRESGDGGYGSSGGKRQESELDQSSDQSNDRSRNRDSQDRSDSSDDSSSGRH